MPRQFEELDYQVTPIGALSLRRRYEPRIEQDVFEIKLDDEFLMSDIITASEIALADLGLKACQGERLDVAVGGLGLGYTAVAVLEEPRVQSLMVVDFLATVIDWHESGLLPLGAKLTTDARCTLRHGDFFALAASDTGIDPENPRRKFHAILVDIDHSPDALLDDRSNSFYTTNGFVQLANHLHDGGIFGLWSDDEPDAGVTERLQSAFAEAWAEPVTFAVPMREDPFTQTVYLARK